MVGDQVYIVTLTGEEDVAESIIRPEFPAPETHPQSYRPADPTTLRRLPDQESPAATSAESKAEGPLADVRAPMPGTILAVEVTPGQRIARGQLLFVMEAMKMRNPIKSPRDGVILEVLVGVGDSVHYHDPLLSFVDGS